MKAIELIKIIEKVKEERYRSNFAGLNLPFDSLTFEQNFTNYINSLIQLEVVPLHISGKHQLISIKDEEIKALLDTEIFKGIWVYQNFRHSDGFRLDYYFDNIEDAKVAAVMELDNEDVGEVIIVEREKVNLHHVRED